MEMCNHLGGLKSLDEHSTDSRKHCSSTMLFLKVFPAKARCWLYTTVESYMVITCVLPGRNPPTRIRARSSAVLVVRLFVPYAADRGCTLTRQSKSMVGRCINNI